MDHEDEMGVCKLNHKLTVLHIPFSFRPADMWFSGQDIFSPQERIQLDYISYTYTCLKRKLLLPYLASTQLWIEVASYNLLFNAVNALISKFIFHCPDSPTERHNWLLNSFVHVCAAQLTFCSPLLHWKVWGGEELLGKHKFPCTHLGWPLLFLANNI